MSVKSELNNTKYYLRESRKAILGRGGEISEKAGLKDIPEAVWSIPADTSLAFREDSEVAYEKVVPVGAEEYARVKSLGGICAFVTKGGSHNLCTADGVYPCNGYSVDIDLGTLDYLKDGMYYLKIVTSNLPGFHRIELNADYYGVVQYGAYGFLDLTFQYVSMDYKGLRFYLTIYSENEMEEDAPLLSGFVDGILICKEEDASKGYAPYEKPELVSVKPTSLESRGANLFDIYRTDFVALNTLTLNNYKPKSENGIMYSGGKFGASAGASIPIYLKPNTDYTFSFDVSWNAETETSLRMELALISSIEEDSVYASEDKKLIKVPTNTQGHHSYTFNSESYIAFVLIAFSTNQYGVEFRNVQLNYGKTEAPYKPFSAEPIDTKSLPEALQSLDGWGLGVNAEYNNHFEVRNGKVFYVQMVEKTVIDGTVNKITYVGKSNDLYYGMLDVASAAKPTINILNSHFKGERVASLGNAYIAGAEAKSLIMFNTNQNLTTVALWNDWLKEEDSKGNPVTSVYALATPIEIDITHLFTDTSPFLKVQGGGSVIAHNERKEAVPSTLKYTIKVG